VTRLRRPTFDERGGTLVEAIVGLALLSIVLLIVATSGVTSMKVRSTSERIATYSTSTQDTMAKARQADYSDLGFFADDPYASTSAVHLPVTGDDGSELVEDAIVLGPNRPAATSTFDVAPVETFERDGATYRVTTWVTAVAPAPGDSVSRARRVVVQGEWAPTSAKDQLDGTCSGQAVRCSVQMIVRTASGSDIDPTSGQSASSTSTCASATPNVCEGYVRSGRVLGGATMVTDSDLARQSQPVDLFARTSVAASAVEARWTYRELSATGTLTTVTKTVPLSSDDDGTRWTGEVPADTGSPKGTIRPGAVTVTFAATVPDGSLTLDVPAFWSLSRNTGTEIDHVGATLPDPADKGWCSPVGGGSPVVVATTGGSVGLSTGGSTTSGDDRAWMVFTVVSASGTVTSQKVPATLVSAAPVTVDLSGKSVQVSTDATWQAQPPATSSCGTSSRVSFVLERAIDRSTTAIPLRLAADPS